MICSQKGCLSSFEWIGAPDDPVIAGMARERGWRVFESRGWLCPHHVHPIKEDQPNE